jgi:hypothetical protein
MSIRKDKQARRLARKKKAQKHNLPSSQEILFKRIQSSDYFKNTKVIPNTGKAEKMSDVILQFAEPLKDEYGIVPPNMLRFAILVWNASVLPENERQELIKDIHKILPDADDEMQEILESIVDMLLERKERYFSDNKRFIVDYNIRETSRRTHLDCVSTMPEGYNPEF